MGLPRSGCPPTSLALRARPCAPCRPSPRTLQLSWFTSPYVLRLSHDPATDTMEATTLTLLARPRTEKFNVAEVGSAHGRGAWHG